MYHNIYGFNSKYDEKKSGKINIKKISELDYNFHPVRGGVVLYYENSENIQSTNLQDFLFTFVNESDKSNKFDKSDKSDKFDKSNKSDKSNKFDKSDKSNKSDKSDKSNKSDKSDKSDKFDKSNNEQKFLVYEKKIPITPISKSSILDGSYKTIMNVGFSNFIKSETLKEYTTTGKHPYENILLNNIDYKSDCDYKPDYKENNTQDLQSNVFIQYKEYKYKKSSIEAKKLIQNSIIKCIPKLCDCETLNETYTVFNKYYNCNNSDLISKKSRYFLIGTDSTYNTLTDFGGTIEYKKDRDPVVGALRELNEESLGLFEYTKDQILDSYCIYNDYLFIIFVKIAENPSSKISKFEKIKSEYSKIEVKQLNLFKDSDFSKLLKLPYVVYEPVRSLINTGFDSLSVCL